MPNNYDQVIDRICYISQVTIPTVYQEGLNNMQVQNIIVNKVNQIIDKLNQNSQWVNQLLTEGVDVEVVEQMQTWLDDGTLANLINNKLLGDWITEFQNQQDSYEADMTQKYNVMKSQLDNFTTSKTPDANTELIDIRVGWDGTAYPSAGDGVREQVSNLNYNLENIIATEDVTNTTIEEGFYFGYNQGNRPNEGFNIISFKTEDLTIYSVTAYITDNIPLVQLSNDYLPFQERSDDRFNLRKTTMLFIGNGQTAKINALKQKEYSIKKCSLYLDKIIDINYLTGTSYVNRVLCIGDSLTRGQSYKSANESFYNKYNYPYFLKEKYFFNSEYVINAARAGYTPRDVWENLYDDISVINNGLVILFLGTNQGLTDTVDIDCPGTILDNFATTQTGYYGKIIQLELNNNNNVILVSPYISSGNLTETKKAIVSFSKKYGLPVVDLNMSYFSNVLRTVNGYTDSTHLNSIGYSKLSDIIVQKASLYLQNNYCEKFIELEEQ